MSDILLSLYGAPSPSMMSRDPTGLDPNGVDDSARLEPAGSRVEESLSMDVPPPPPSPTDHRGKIDVITGIDIAGLVGIPPPPPMTPPPKKNRRSRGASTPRAMTVNKDFESFSVDTSTVDSAPRVYTTTSPKDQNAEDTLHTRNIAILSPKEAEDNDDDFAPPAPPGPRDEQTALNSADERRKSALAIYQSKDLFLEHEALDHAETLLAQELLRPAMTTLENIPQVVSERPSPRKPPSPSPRQVPSPSPKTFPSSPSSEVTRPHSNQSRSPANSRSQASPRLTNIYEAPSLDPPSGSDTSSQTSEEKKVEKKGDRRRRSFSLERKNKNDKNFTKTEKMKDDKQKRDQKRGFFKKLFRGKGKEKGSSQEGSNKHQDPPIGQKTSIRGLGTPKANEPMAEKVFFLPPVHSQQSPMMGQPPLKPVLKRADERQYQGDPVEPVAMQPSPVVAPQTANIVSSPVHSQTVNSPASPATSSHQNVNVEVSIPEPTTEETPIPAHSPNEASHGSLKTPMTFSQDPPDDEHGDPPVYSGPPLLSPTSIHQQLHVSTSQEEEEENRIESVRSRLAGVYEEHLHSAHDEHNAVGFPSSFSNDEQDFPFNHDELSILTGPSFEALQNRSKSFDPTQAIETTYSDPLGEYQNNKLSTKAQDDGPAVALGSKDIDAYETTFFTTKENVTLPTPVHLSHLRVQVPAQTIDPAGDSPLKFSARGRPAIESAFRDPVGDSPMAWQKVQVSMNDPVGESPYHFEMKNTEFDYERVDESQISQDTAKAPVHDSEVEETQEKEFDDPPLTAGYVSDASSCAGAEEKKEEDDMIEGPIETLVSKSKGIEDQQPSDEDSETLGENHAKKVVRSSENSTRPPQKVKAKSEYVELSTINRSKRTVLATGEKFVASKATRAALKLKSAKRNGTDAIKEQLATISTPRSKGSSDNRVGSAPLALSKQKEAEHVANLQVETSVGQSGFRSAPSTPSSTEKPLTVTAAAFTNAKAVAYFHQLHGEPSPRHSWHVGKTKHSEPSPVASGKRDKKKTKKKKANHVDKDMLSQKKAPSPDDYGAHNFDETQISVEPKEKLQSSKEKLKAKYLKKKDGPDKMFSAYRSKFQGRKPSKKKAPIPEAAMGKRAKAALSPNSKLKSFPSKKAVVVRPGRITSMAVAKGIKLRRSKRKQDIESGRAAPVILTPKPQPTGRNRFNFFPAKESEIKDPIQRAGRRLLSKSAIPIQTAARRYIAKRVAIDRMWALIEIQSCFRRWRCETNLQANIHSATVIEAAFRGFLARVKVKDMHYSATQIQKIVRGHLAAAQVYDTIYYVTRIQALMKGCYERKMVVKREAAAVVLQKNVRGYHARSVICGSSHAKSIQAMYRGFKARQDFAVALVSVSMIQSAWRSYSAQISFQFQIVDIIIVQSIVRRWTACERVLELKKMQHFGPVSKVQARWRGCAARTIYNQNLSAQKIQTAWRGFQSYSTYQKNLSARKIQTAWRGFQCYSTCQKNLSARKIQASWRGFQCYTDYIFALVDILVVQRTVRQWLAIRKAKTIRQAKAVMARAIRHEEAAIVLQTNWRRHRAQTELLHSVATLVIQTNWRRYKAQTTLLYSMVHIIIAQSVARRHLSHVRVAERKQEIQKRQAAATSIQKSWRGFWEFSHYIIAQYEITHLQSIMRGKLARQAYNLKLGCAIIIQATARRHLAKKALDMKIISDALVASAVHEMRERNAARRVQFWWRIVQDWMNEKKAALTIEKFFINVREEVDREIRRRERKKSAKKDKRRKKRRESSEEESTWLNTVEEDKTVSYVSETQSEKDSRSKSAPRLRESLAGVPTAAPPHRTPTLGMNQRASPRAGHGSGQEVDLNGRPSKQMDSSNSRPTIRPPTDAVRMTPSEDHSDVSGITTPSVLYRMGNSTSKQLKTTRTDRTDEMSFEQNFDNAPVRQSRDKSRRVSSDESSQSSRDNRMSTEDYIKKYGGLQTAPNRLATGQQPKHFFSEDGGTTATKPPHGTPTAVSQSQTQATTQATTPRSSLGATAQRRSSSGTPRAYPQGQSTPRSSAGTPRSFSKGGQAHTTTPRETVGTSPGLSGTPRSQSHGHQLASPRIPTGQTRDRHSYYPPVTPTSRHKKQQSIVRRETADTESQSTMSQTTFSKSSPRSRPDGHLVHGSTPVMVMKTYPNFAQTHSIEEAQELLYLGDEYGEV